mmetsp:Transcript_20826/g.28312  ORF Transcript_20826/g.28312 Transcript_20826/m.28312 type:complete len:642 (-) Transcript_20826:506-2431(-)
MRRPSNIRTPNGANRYAERNAPATEGKRIPTTLEHIKKLEEDREARRKAASERRKDKAAEVQRNVDAGIVGDAEFLKMIRAWRENDPAIKHRHAVSDNMKVCICVRKRPINSKEIKRQDLDCVTCLNPTVVVHGCKLRVDGISKYLDNQNFAFDHSFGEESTTEEVYFYACQPLVSYVCRGGRATCFAYGQTGSGKTFTMEGIQSMAVDDLFSEIASTPEHSSVTVHVSFFEIYGGRCQDLLNERHRLIVREDGKGEVHVSGLEEFQVNNAEELLTLIEAGNRMRTTQKTEANDTSSRSHAVCQIALRKGQSSRLMGKLSLVDLAGSERGNDTKSHNRQLRTESAEINKSLLALKECIRGIASNSVHVPFRASKLTMVLRDSFVRPNSRVAMISTVSPAMYSADHTINTLRYADRVKEKDMSKGNVHGSKQSEEQLREDEAKFQEWIQDREGGAGEAQQQQQPKPRTNKAADYSSGGGGGNYDKRYQDQAEEKTGQEQKRNQERKKVEIQDSMEELDLGYDDRAENGDRMEPGLTVDSPHVADFHKTVDRLFEEEEQLLNLHMNVIQENAELLTEEGRLLQGIQGDEVGDYDIDAYAARLQEILDRKGELIALLQGRLSQFRSYLGDEEAASQRVGSMPQY